METSGAWGFSHKMAGGARLTLEQNESHTLSPLPQGIRVLSGMAWVTWKGEDIVLKPGQAMRFSQGGRHPVISAMGLGRLTVEMLD